MKEILQELGPYKFYQLKPSHMLTSVTVLLCDFISPLSGKTQVIDLGTGSGVIPMLLTLKTEASDITGVEVSSTLFKIAEKNIRENSLEDKVSLLKSDWRDLYDIYDRGSFSHVISNPPYFKKDAGRISPHKDRAAARTEIFGDMTDLVRISKHLAGDRGRIYYVYPVDRLEELKEVIKNEGLSLGRFKFVYTKNKDGEVGDAQFFLAEFGIGCRYDEQERVILDGGRLY